MLARMSLNKERYKMTVLILTFSDSTIQKLRELGEEKEMTKFI
jgi:hypothetical protein